MKKFLVVLFVCLMVVPNVSAAEITQPVTFQWDWDTSVEQAPDLRWRLFMRDEGGTYDYTKPVVDAAYDGTSQLTENFTIAGTDGEKVTKYFVLRAYANGGESGDSNEVSYEFEIPRGIPQNLRITVNVNVNVAPAN